MKSTETEKQYTYRNIARIVIEADTPIAISNGNNNMMTDSLAATDVNGLPYIPGTSIAGVVRHAIGEDKAKAFFGYQNPRKSKDGWGSDIIFTDAKMVGEDGTVIDGINSTIDWSNDFYSHFKYLPIRQHVRINDKGTTDKGGKFDEQVVYKGTRFCFEIEMVSEKAGNEDFKKVINALCSGNLRLGSGTRSGFGDFKIVKDLCKEKNYNLCEPKELDLYLQKSSDFSEEWDGDDLEYSSTDVPPFDKYELTLNPEDFFLFGSGMGDEDADMTPVREDFITWENNRATFHNDAVLIPATSLKGALSHRVAFYWNKEKKRYADGTDPDKKPLVGSENPAVLALFGSEDSNKPQRGNALFSDIIETEDVKDKILNHVSIDRFTGGAIDTALFTEKTVYGRGCEFKTNILVCSQTVADKATKDAFELALMDICKGLLPLGGGVNRGNGCFNGTLKLNGEPIFPKEEGNE